VPGSDLFNEYSIVVLSPGPRDRSFVITSSPFTFRVIVSVLRNVPKLDATTVMLTSSPGCTLLGSMVRFEYSSLAFGSVTSIYFEASW